MIDRDLAAAFWDQTVAGWWPPVDDEAADRAADLLEAVTAAVDEYTGASQVETHLGEAATRYRRGDPRALDEFERRLRSSRALQIATRSAYAGFLDPPQMWSRLDAILGSDVQERHKLRRRAAVTQALLAPLVRARCDWANRQR